MSKKIQDKFKFNLLEVFLPENKDFNDRIYRILKFKSKKIQKTADDLFPTGLSEEFTTEIFNLLIKFFSRYYKNGEFLAKKRFYENLKMPNNWEEVQLNWVNMDQHYVVTKDYLKRNSKDYFIHKELRGFLENELDLFLKNEVLDFEDLINNEYLDARAHLIKAKEVKCRALRIIDILAQIETFQVKLWEKKKLVIKTEFIITLDKIIDYAGASFLIKNLDEILMNKKQKQEWKDLYNVEINNVNDLIEGGEILNPNFETLPIDTKFFNNEFKWNLIASLTKNNSLDKVLDGLLIKSDNYQALNTIMNKYGKKVNLIYIDPPYNTGIDYSFFKNSYSESSWLTIMCNRLNLAKHILNDNGNIFVRIDINGNYYIRFLLNTIFGKKNFRNEIIVNKTKAKQRIKNQLIQQTESLFFYSVSDKSYFNQVEIPNKEPKWYELLDFPRPNKNPRIVLGKEFYPPKNRRWALSQKRIDKFEQNGKVRINKKKKYVDCFGNVINEKPELLYDSEPIRSDWLDIPGYSQVHKFPTEDFEQLLQRVIESGSREDDIVLDFFLGSGTTIATAHKLNRKWVGVEMGPQFEEFVIPRMKSVLRGERTGISKIMTPKSSGFFKYQYLEQFEDTIENIEIEHQINEILLNIEKIDDPFQFKIKILENDQLKTVNVDLIETFNYLLGLFVEKINASAHDGRTYIFITGKVNNQDIIVVWRSIIELDYERDQKIIKENLKDNNYDILYVNGSCSIEGYNPIEVELKKLICGC